MKLLLDWFASVSWVCCSAAAHFAHVKTQKKGKPRGKSTLKAQRIKNKDEKSVKISVCSESHDDILDVPSSRIQRQAKRLKVDANVTLISCSRSQPRRCPRNRDRGAEHGPFPHVILLGHDEGWKRRKRSKKIPPAIVLHQTQKLWSDPPR